MDFGLSRIAPAQDEQETEFHDKRRKAYKECFRKGIISDHAMDEFKARVSAEYQNKVDHFSKKERDISPHQ